MFDCYTAPVKDTNAVSHGRVWFFRDVTERQAQAQERERLIQELEAKNAELERFTYTVSHDLKNPLVTIKAFLGSLQSHVERGDLDRHRADLKRISDAADRLRDLLEGCSSFRGSGAW